MSLPPDIADSYGRGEEPERLARGPEGQRAGELPFENERFGAVLLLGAGADLLAAGRR